MRKSTMTPVQNNKSKIYNDSSMQQDYVSILETILSDDSAGIKLQREGERRAFIHNKFMRDSISSLHDRNYVFYNVDPQKLMKILDNQLTGYAESDERKEGNHPDSSRYQSSVHC